MQTSTFTLTDYSGEEIFVYKWAPEAGVSAKAVVHILHGMAEHGARYTHVAEALTKAGYIVYADDHKGHGKTAKDLSRAGWLGDDGWEGTLKAIKEVSDKAKEENPGLPFFLFGHSWGSYLAQDYIQRWADALNGAILSGTNGEMAQIGMLLFIMKIIILFKGPKSPAKFVHNLAVGPFSKEFTDIDSPNNWLSRDPAVVKAYDDDPWCGFVATNGYFNEMGRALKRVWKPENEAKIPKNLPLYFFSGGQDPTNAQATGMQALVERYKALGISDITEKIYPEDRHETLNELDKETVIQDTIAWLDAHVA